LLSPLGAATDVAPVVSATEVALVDAAESEDARAVSSSSNGTGAGAGVLLVPPQPSKMNSDTMAAQQPNRRKGMAISQF
jgi:hypothetical protein